MDYQGTGISMRAFYCVIVAHTTVLRRVQRLVPVFEKKWKKYARPVGISWRVDETCIKVKGVWRYLQRAVDKQGMIKNYVRTKRFVDLIFRS
jgi:transposase-like protein